MLLESEPDTFFLTEHYRPYPCVLVNLLAVDASTLQPLIEQAWRMIASKRTILACAKSRGAKETQPSAVANRYPSLLSRSHDAVIRVYDAAATASKRMNTRASSKRVVMCGHFFTTSRACSRQPFRRLSPWKQIGEGERGSHL
jgi:hypothetical protein